MARLSMLALACCVTLLRATPEPLAPARSQARTAHGGDKTSAVTPFNRKSDFPVKNRHVPNQSQYLFQYLLVLEDNPVDLGRLPLFHAWQVPSKS